MKKIILLAAFFTTALSYSQSLPIDFENNVVTTANFVDFDGGVGQVVANPSMSGINMSSTVAQIVRDGGEIYGGSKILLSSNLDFSIDTKISMKVYTTAAIGTVVKFKLEGTGSSADVNATTTVTGAWETLEWIFAGTANDLNEVVFMFDYGNVGDGTVTSTFYFDDVAQVSGPPAPVPASLPIDFESDVVTSDFLSFAGATARVIANPQMSAGNTSNMVCQVVKDGGEYWAGSQLLLTNNLDFTTNWHIEMKIFSTAPVGTRMKLELVNSSAKYNRDYVTTVTGAWETASWNFDGQSNDFDRLNFHFDYGNIGDGTATSTFLFDDVFQIAGPAIPDAVATSLPVGFENGVVTSDFTDVFGAVTEIISNPQMNADNPSANVGRFVRSGGAPWAQSKLQLTNFMNYSVNSGISMKVFTDAPIGTLLKFKVESTATGAANEKNILTTVSGVWETYTWDFAGDPPVYNVITLMLGYNVVNNASSNATFLFDDIQQVSTLSNDDHLVSVLDGITAYPNPSQDYFNITSNINTINSITLHDVLGQRVKTFNVNGLNAMIDVTDLVSGIYFATIKTDNGTGSIKLVVN
jgi:uncharacterized lipoprotein YajG